MLSPPFPRYLVTPRSKYSPQHHVLKRPQLLFLPQYQRPSFTPIQNNRQNYSSIYLDLYFNKINPKNCISSIPHSLWLFMPFTHSVKKPTLGDYSFHIRRPTTSSCCTESWDQFYYKSGKMFAVLKFTYFTKGLFQTLNSLLALVFIGWSHTHNQLLHARAHARTHTQTHAQSVSRN